MARTADDWDRLYIAGEPSGATLTIREEVKFRQFVRPQSGQVVVDAGCGRGEFTRQLSQYGCDVTGLDWSVEALLRARRALPGDPPRQLKYLQHDLNGDGLPPGVELSSVDLVVCRHSLAHLSDHQGILSRAREWLRPGGAAYAMTRVREKLPTRLAGTGLSEEEISVLDRGWASAVRYGLGRSAVVVLRKAANAP
ncbi:class I SAM-dependent methyltransferase [Streptomyces syringium]|uniref:class I SAM-dependent methyltransferase n=1 Tax=Streptomyces syringium TaxID=76729 RepID=UPI0037CE1B6A